MESPPSMEVEELLNLLFHRQRTEEKTGLNAKASVEEAKILLRERLAVIGCLKDETTDADADLGVASKLDDIPFGITGDEAVCSEYGVKGEGVILVKIFDNGKDLFTEGVIALT